jgi:hypothetical protein
VAGTPTQIRMGQSHRAKDHSHAKSLRCLGQRWFKIIHKIPLKTHRTSWLFVETHVRPSAGRCMNLSRYRVSGCDKSYGDTLRIMQFRLTANISTFLHHVMDIWLRAFHRRSQRDRSTWKRIMVGRNAFCNICSSDTNQAMGSEVSRPRHGLEDLPAIFPDALIVQTFAIPLPVSPAS